VKGFGCRPLTTAPRAPGPASESREPFDAADMPLDAPCRRARTDAGGALGRDALDAGTVAGGTGSSPALGREALDCRHGGERRRIKPG
jgi:hypothetical protein